jgi:hypothetical protein
VGAGAQGGRPAGGGSAKARKKQGKKKQYASKTPATARCAKVNSGQVEVMMSKLGGPQVQCFSTSSPRGCSPAHRI